MIEHRTDHWHFETIDKNHHSTPTINISNIVPVDQNYKIFNPRAQF